MLILILFNFVSCKYTPPHAGGKPTQVVVLCEKSIYNSVKNLLSQSLERTIYTPTNENIFDIKWFPPQKFNYLRYRRNCLILGLIGDSLIDIILSDSAKNKLFRGEEYVFGANDLFTKNQSILVISAPTIEKLKSVLKESNEIIFNFFVNGVLAELKSTLYKDGYTSYKKGNVSIRIPKGWIVADDKPNFISFIRHNPDRIISIYYEYAPEIKLDKENAIKLRNKLCELFFPGDYVDTHRTIAYFTDFLGNYSLKLDGIWQNDSIVMGGPFHSYMFSYDGKIYFIDMHIFAPGEKKWRFLQQLEIICQTIKFQ